MKNKCEHDWKEEKIDNEVVCYGKNKNQYKLVYFSYLICKKCGMAGKKELDY